MLLLGDGAQTAFDPQVETQQAARKLRDDFAAPLYTVTFGLAGDAAQARDVAIDRLDEQFTVFVKNELVVRGIVRVRGYAKQGFAGRVDPDRRQGADARRSAAARSAPTKTTGRWKSSSPTRRKRRATIG